MKKHPIKAELQKWFREGRTRKDAVRNSGYTKSQVYKHWPQKVAWTNREIALLKKHWQEVNERGLRALLPNRSWRAIRQTATRIGLPSGIPQGCIAIRTAATRYGCAPRTVLAVAKTAGIQIKRRYRDGGWQGNRPFCFVEWDEIRDALDEYYQLQTVYQCSKELCVDDGALRRKLRLLGHYPPPDGTVWRIRLELAKHAASMENTTEARIRHNLTKGQLELILKKAGLRNGKRLEMLPAQWDALLKGHP